MTSVTRLREASWSEMTGRRQQTRKRVVMNKHRNPGRSIFVSVLVFAQILPGVPTILAQSSATDSENRMAVINAGMSLPPISSLTKYFDPQTGITVDQAVAY